MDRNQVKNIYLSLLMSIPAKTVIPVLDKVISAYGIPRVIKTDATCNYRPDPTQAFVWERTKDHVTNGTFAYDGSSHR